ncbi:MAG: hypothetical protein Sw2LagTSB_01190 [Shewanella algae]
MALADEAPRFAGGSFAGNLTFASDYVFRGESETLDGDVPVVQGTFSWNHDAGWYAGVFASNIKFADPNLEIVTAPFIGKSGELGDSGFVLLQLHRAVAETRQVFRSGPSATGSDADCG